jgi:hypothetical protein
MRLKNKKHSKYKKWCWWVYKARGSILTTNIIVINITRKEILGFGCKILLLNNDRSLHIVLGHG